VCRHGSSESLSCVVLALTVALNAGRCAKISNIQQPDDGKRGEPGLSQLLNFVMHHNIGAQSNFTKVVLGAHQVTIYQICTRKVCLLVFLGTYSLGFLRPEIHTHQNQISV
jgi:hypothetical protein